MFVEDTSTKDRVSPDFQTPRREMKIRSVSGVFQFDELRGVSKFGQTLT